MLYCVGMMRVVLLVTLASHLSVAGCVFDDDIDSTDTQLAIRVEAVDGLEEVSLTIYSDATCAGNRAIGGTPLVGFEGIVLRENEAFAGSIPVGDRAFEVQGMSTTMPICVGACEEETVVAGMLTQVVLNAVEVPCGD